MARRAWRLLAALVAAFALVALAVTPAAAEVQTSGASVEMPDPASITFSIQVTGDPITEARLIHSRFNPEGRLGGEIRAEVPSRGTGVITATLETINARAYIPVGTQFTYHWRLVGEDGSIVETEPQDFVFLDGRFDWNLIEDDGVRVYWYADETLAQRVLVAARETVRDIGALLETEIDFPVTVVLYGGGDDGLAAQRPRGGVYDELSRTGGTRVAPDLVHVYDSLGLSWEDITRHEVAHIITSQAGDGPFTSIPSWLDEGIATYAQEQKGGRAVALEFAIQTDNTLRLRNLSAPVNRAELIELFYGQSWSVVEYLIDTYGEEAMADLLAAIKAGSTTDEALMTIYGVDQDGLYNEWRVANGLEALEFEPVAEATTIPRADATRAPLTLPTSVTGAGSASGDSDDGGAAAAATETVDDASDESTALEDGGGGNTTTAIAIAVVTLLLAGGLGAVGLRMLRAKA